MDETLPKSSGTPLRRKNRRRRNKNNAEKGANSDSNSLSTTISKSKQKANKVAKQQQQQNNENKSSVKSGNNVNNNAKKKNRFKNKKKQQQESKEPPPTPLTPLTKLVLHHITRSTLTHLTDKSDATIQQKLADWLQNVVLPRYNKNSSSLSKIAIDEQSLELAIKSERAILKAKQEWISQINKVESDSAVAKEDDQSNANHDTVAENGSNNDKHDHDDNDDDKMPSLIGPETKNEVQSDNSKVLLLRWSYMTYPKKLKRHGDSNEEKPGCLYFVLHGPRILGKSSDAVVASDNDTNANAKNVDNGNYSAELNQSRHILQNAITSLQKTIADIQQHVPGIEKDVMIQLQEARHPKVFKSNVMDNQIDRRRSQFNRLLGTIYKSPDYIEYIKKQAENVELLQSRPKPAPGGMASNSHSADLKEANAPVAALVEHLRQKRLEEEQQNKNKRKQKQKQQTPNSKGSTNNGSAKKSESMKKQNGKSSSKGNATSNGQEGKTKSKKKKSGSKRPTTASKGPSSAIPTG